MTTLSANVWKHLPFEIVEQILSFLPVRDLCRDLTVCKRWHSLICKPEFGTLCVRNAKPGSCFIFVRHTQPLYSEMGQRPLSEQNYGWSILDLNSRQWFTIITHRRVKEQRGEGNKFDRHFGGSVAVDGGLVCEFWRSHHLELLELWVYNPVGKTQHVLPLPFSYDYSGELNMVVDNTGHSFKVFVMNRYTDVGKPLLRVYDSTCSEWRSATDPPTPAIRVGSFVRNSVIFEGMLHVLFYLSQPDHSPENKLWRYNHVKDVWENTGVGHTLPNKLCLPSLVVSDNRLFLGTWTREISGSWCLDMSELSRVEKVRKLVFRVTHELAEHVTDGRQGPAPTDWYISSPPPDMKAFGSFKSIIFRSTRNFDASRGIFLLAYDLVTGSWDLLPEIPLKHKRNSDEVLTSSWFPKSTNVMNLVLPGVLPGNHT